MAASKELFDTLKGIDVESLIAAIVGYSGVLGPSLTIWAIVTLCLNTEESDNRYCQAVFFGAMVLIGFLTVRAMLLHDPCWLLNGASLGVLIVGGALKGSVDTQSSVLSGN